MDPPNRPPAPTWLAPSVVAVGALVLAVLALEFPPTWAAIALLVAGALLGLHRATATSGKQALGPLILLLLLLLGMQVVGVATVGWVPFALAILVVVVFAYAARRAPLHRRYLLFGTAICGAAAILALRNQDRTEAKGTPSDTSRAADESAALAVASIVLIGTLALVLAPLAARVLGTATGAVWAGLTTHALPQAIAAGILADPEQGGFLAGTIKLLRVALLPVGLLLAGPLLAAKETPEGTAPTGLARRLLRPEIQLFALGALVGVGWWFIGFAPAEQASYRATLRVVEGAALVVIGTQLPGALNRKAPRTVLDALGLYLVLGLVVAGLLYVL